MIELVGNDVSEELNQSSDIDAELWIDSANYVQCKVAMINEDGYHLLSGRPGAVAAAAGALSQNYGLQAFWRLHEVGLRVDEEVRTVHWWYEDGDETEDQAQDRLSRTPPISLGAFLIMQQPGLKLLEQLAFIGVDLHEQIKDRSLGALALEQAAQCRRWDEVAYLLREGVDLDENGEDQTPRLTIIQYFIWQLKEDRRPCGIRALKMALQNVKPGREDLRSLPPSAFRLLLEFRSKGLVQDFIDYATDWGVTFGETEEAGDQPIELYWLLNAILAESKKHAMLHRTLMGGFGELATHCMIFLVGEQSDGILPSIHLLPHEETVLQELAEASYPLVRIILRAREEDVSSGRQDDVLPHLMEIDHDEELVYIDEFHASDIQEEQWAQRVQLNLSMALQEFFPNQIVLITYRRFPAIFRAALLEGPELHQCREGLDQRGFSFELPSGAKMALQAYEYQFALRLVENYDLGKQHVIVSAVFELPLQQVIAQLPSRANVRERDRKVLFNPHQLQVNRTFVHISEQIHRGMSSVTNSTTEVHGGVNPRRHA